MSTRAGSAGLIAGLVITMWLYLVKFNAPAVLPDWHAQESIPQIPSMVLVFLLFISGFWGARSGGSPHPGRCIAMGALAGGLAGTVTFALWGAAAAGNQSAQLRPDVAAVIRLTMEAFLFLFLSGGAAGGLGGWIAAFLRRGHTDKFDMTEPQMAMNASITALPASIIATALTAAAFPRLSTLIAGGAVLGKSAAEWPLNAGLLLVLASHLAVTLVVPHESRMSEHLCGMDEVKMAAYVGIGAAPLLILLLLLVYPGCFTNPLVLTALMFSTWMSFVSYHSLVKRILPKRASFPPHEEGRKKKEAVLFGSIADSIAGRLVVLCIGCGLVMVLPLYCVVISVLVNLNAVVGHSSDAMSTVNLFANQALASIGMAAASIGALILIYMLYLNLGRWFSKRNLTDGK